MQDRTDHRAVILSLAVLAALLAALVHLYPWHHWTQPAEVFDIQEPDSTLAVDFEVLHPLPGFVLSGDFIVVYVNVSLDRLTATSALRIGLQEVSSGARIARFVPLDRAKAETLDPLHNAVIVAQRMQLERKDTDYILSAALISAVSPTASVYIEAKPVRFSVLPHNVDDWSLFAMWLRNNHAKWHLETVLAKLPSGDTYRKAVVTKALPAGAVVAEIPASVTIDYQSVLRSPLMRWLGPHLLNQTNDDVVFAAYLSWCIKFSEHCPHAPYLRSLPAPEAMPYLPLWWTHDEMTLFEGTSLRHEIITSKDYAASVLADAEELIEKSKELSKAIDRYSVEYALVAIGTRCWGDGHEYADGQRRLRLCPLLDLLNHENNATFLDSEKAGYFRCTTAQALQPGDETYVNYGQDKSANHKFLLYGWLAPMEEIRICREIHLAASDNFTEAFLDLRSAITTATKVVVHRGGSHCVGVATEAAWHKFLAAMRIGLLHPKDVHKRDADRIIADMTEHDGIISVGNEKRVLDDLDDTFTALLTDLKLYTTATDEGIVDGSVNETNYLRRAAATFKVGERRVCEWVLEQISQRRALLRAKFAKRGGKKAKSKAAAKATPKRDATTPEAESVESSEDDDGDEEPAANASQ